MITAQYVRLLELEMKAKRDKEIAGLKERVHILRCGLCDVDLSQMTKRELQAHMKSEKHVKIWKEVLWKEVLWMRSERK